MTLDLQISGYPAPSASLKPAAGQKKTDALDGSLGFVEGACFLPFA